MHAGRALRRGGCEDEPADDVGADERYLLGDEAAQ